MPNSFTIVLDLDKHSSHDYEIVFRQGEQRMPEVTAIVTDKGEPVDLTGWTVKYKSRAGNGAHVSADAAVSGPEATFTMPALTGYPPGKAELSYLEIVKDGIVLTTCDFPITILKGAT